MSERAAGGEGDDRRAGKRPGGGQPPGRRLGGRPAAPGRAASSDGARGGKSRRGGLGLQRLGGDDFALVHPKCIHEMELDYVEGIELREAGDPEAARDALRYALQGCGDNLWVHVALGRIALDDFQDPTLARGHFGYAFELAERALPRDFVGRLSPDHPMNLPFFDALDGLIACYDALGQPQQASELRDRRDRLAGQPPRPPRGRP